MLSHVAAKAAISPGAWSGSDAIATSEHPEARLIHVVGAQEGTKAEFAT